MVKVQLGKECVTFKLEGAQKFLALKSSVRIPLKKIAGVSTEAVEPLWLAGRVGTHMPPIFWAGTFWTIGGKTFYYVRDRSKCITVRSKNYEYRKVVMEVEDKESIAQDLRKLIG